MEIRKGAKPSRQKKEESKKEKVSLASSFCRDDLTYNSTTCFPRNLALTNSDCVWKNVPCQCHRPVIDTAWSHPPLGTERQGSEVMALPFNGCQITGKHRVALTCVISLYMCAYVPDSYMCICVAIYFTQLYTHVWTHIRHSKNILGTSQQKLYMDFNLCEQNLSLNSLFYNF